MQLNGYRYKKGATKLIIKDEKKFSFYNKKKLICQFARKYNFKYTLYICRVSDYKRICPSLSIYPSRFTQDEQLISQIFGTLNGSFLKSRYGILLFVKIAITCSVWMNTQKNLN